MNTWSSRPLGRASHVLIALLFFSAGSVFAATAMKQPLDGDPSHADISGMWNPEFAYFGPPIDKTGHPVIPAGPPTAERSAKVPEGPPPGMPSGPQLTPAYAKRYADWAKKAEDGKQEPDSVTRCLAFGFARFGTKPVEIIQTPGQVTMNLGVLHDIRRIYLDGVGHTIGADPSFNGDSVGHWQGDTLVVETNNIRSGTLDRFGIPYSDKLTATEKIRRVSPARLEIETTLTDPEAFAVPYTLRRAYVPMPPGSRFEEYLCENNRDL